MCVRVCGGSHYTDVDSEGGGEAVYVTTGKTSKDLTHVQR